MGLFFYFCNYPIRRYIQFYFPLMLFLILLPGIPFFHQAVNFGAIIYSATLFCSWLKNAFAGYYKQEQYCRCFQFLF